MVLPRQPSTPRGVGAKNNKQLTEASAGPMQPVSLLPKYLLITAAVCVAAVGVTAFALYLVFRWSLDDALSQSAQMYQEQMLERVERHARSTTMAIASRVAEYTRGQQEQEINGVMERAMGLGGASLVVLLDESGEPRGHAGNIGLLPLARAAVPGETLSRGGAVVSRMPVSKGEGLDASIAQIFDATITTTEIGFFRGALSGLLARYGRESLLWGALISLFGSLAAALLLVAFARRQVQDIRLLTRAAERLTGGAYDEGIGLPRQDELGRLAESLDGLRERLRRTTISRDYLDKVLGSMSEALLIVGPDGRVRRVNAAAAHLLDQSEADLAGRPVQELFAPSGRDEFVLSDSGGRARESSLIGAGGQQIPVSYTLSEIRDNDPALMGFIIAARNIAERKLAERRIRYLARIDPLTKVPNRMQFQHLLQRAIARNSRGGRRFALLYLDLDRFKDINDIYGHSAGDVCLEALTERLTRMLPEGTTVGRFAGDEFGIIMENIEADDDPAAQLAGTARSILRVISQPLPFHGHQIHMTASIGIATHPVDARNVIDLVRSADSALYHAKRLGGDTFEFFDPEMNALAAERLMLKSRLRRAYQRNELLLHYQPKVDLRTGRVVGAEALVRWDLSERGIVLPSEFIPLAEESKLILDIGEWVLDRVCQDFRAWQAELLFPGKIAVNLSLKQLRQPNFCQRVGGIFRRHGVPLASLELEITESTLMENAERTLKILDELYQMGITLAIDDFGTGYSSLSALQKFPISTLKIDRSFVTDAAGDPDDAMIVSTIIQMGRGLDLDVVAEGVESGHQLAFLRTAGCHYGQGLLFGPPVGADELLELLLSQRHGAAAFGGLVETVDATRMASRAV